MSKPSNTPGGGTVDETEPVGQANIEGSPVQLGYGHRAHQPDPDASYVFNPGKPRTLPEEEKNRWKVTG